MKTPKADNKALKKLFIVEKEVLAYSIQEAVKARGRVFKISEAAAEFQPTKSEKIGFAEKK